MMPRDGGWKKVEGRGAGLRGVASGRPLLGAEEAVL